MNKGEQAKTFFLQGYNCAQSVLLAFSEDYFIPREMIEKLSLSFGGGMGRMRLTCGTVSGMMMAAGLIFGYSGIDGKKKSEHYALVQELAHRFQKKNGSIICAELLTGIKVDSSPNAEERTSEYYKKRPCAQYAYDAAELLQEMIEERKKED